MMSLLVAQNSRAPLSCSYIPINPHMAAGIIALEDDVSFEKC